MIYDEELKIAGSIDMLYMNKNGNLDIYDWKRCKNITKENYWRSSTTKCIGHLPDSNFWHYSLQLNVYKYILERNYDVKIDDLYIVCLHPNQTSYIKMKIPNLKDEIDALFSKRLEELDEKDKIENSILTTLGQVSNLKSKSTYEMMSEKTLEMRYNEHKINDSLFTKKLRELDNNEYL